MQAQVGRKWCDPNPHARPKHWPTTGLRDRVIPPDQDAPGKTLYEQRPRDPAHSKLAASNSISIYPTQRNVDLARRERERRHFAQAAAAGSSTKSRVFGDGACSTSFASDLQEARRLGTAQMDHRNLRSINAPAPKTAWVGANMDQIAQQQQQLKALQPAAIPVHLAAPEQSHCGTALAAAQADLEDETAQLDTMHEAAVSAQAMRDAERKVGISSIPGL